MPKPLKDLLANAQLKSGITDKAIGPSKEHGVEHFFYFSNKDEMDKCIVELLDLGYSDIETSERENENGKYRWSLFMIDYDVERANVLTWEHHEELTALAEKYGGTYDGSGYGFSLEEV